MNNQLHILKRIGKARLRQVVLIENFVHYCEGHPDFLKTQQGRAELKGLIITIKTI